MEIYDCIIVGSGPSGGAAAYCLAKYGHKVLIIEKESLPRYKPCGGGVSPIVRKWFDFDFTPVISQRVKTFCYTWNMSDPVVVELEMEQPLWMVFRNEFDYFLVKQSLRHGLKLQQETEVKGVKFSENIWYVSTNKGEVKAKYLIAADGAKGPMHNLLGFKERKRIAGGAIEAEASLKITDENVVHFEFGMVKNGYLWNFPKSCGYSIGIGVFRNSESQNLKSIVSNYSKLFNVDFNTTKRYAHPLCLWDGDQVLHTKNERALLTGETACLVDPLTAEGIRPSIFSGLKAGEAIHKALGGDLNALKDYTKIIHREIGIDMKIAKQLSRILYQFPELCYKNILKRPTATKVMAKILFGEMRYRDLQSQTFKKLGNMVAGAVAR